MRPQQFPGGMPQANPFGAPQASPFGGGPPGGPGPQASPFGGGSGPPPPMGNNMSQPPPMAMNNSMSQPGPPGPPGPSGPPQFQQQQQNQNQMSNGAQSFGGQQQGNPSPFPGASQQQGQSPFPGAPPGPGGPGMQQPGMQQPAMPMQPGMQQYQQPQPGMGMQQPQPGMPMLMQQPQPQPGMLPQQPGMQVQQQGPGMPGVPSFGPGGNSSVETLQSDLHNRAQQFNCGSQFIRPSMTRIPQSLMTKKKLGLPLGAMIQPLSKNMNVQGARSCDFVPSTFDQNTGRSQAALGSIIRCKACRAYINPFIVWGQNGRRWRCNMCGNMNECAQVYYAPMDEQTGQRVDIANRPELNSGGLEYTATPDYIQRPAQPPMQVFTPYYIQRPAQPPIFLFLIEVTQRSIQSGFVAEACAGIKEAITKFTAMSDLSPDDPNYVENGSSRALCGVMTFDTSLHFYSLENSVNESDDCNPQMIVVSDLDDLFLPLPGDMMVNMYEKRDMLCNLLDTIPNMFRETKVTESCYNSALKGSFLVLRYTGGKISSFVSTCPTLGPDGKCNPHREIQALRDVPGTTAGGGMSAAAAQGLDKAYDVKESELLKAISEDYRQLAGKMIMNQVCVDMYVAPMNSFFDLATVKLVTQFSGGYVYYYDNFTPQQHSRKLREEIIHSVNRPGVGYEAVLRIRVSQGWSITNFFGNLMVRGQDLLAIPNCDSDFTMGVQVEMNEGVSVVDHQLFFQIALLYTMETGERRIRIMTHSVVATQNYTELLQSVDPQAAACVFFNLVCERAVKSSLAECRTFLTSTMHQIVSTHANIRQQEQGDFQFLPLYLFGLLKSMAIRPGVDMNADRRTAVWSRLSNLCIEKMSSYFVPRLIALHDMNENEGVVDENGSILLPEKLNLSSNSLTPAGCYLIENGFQIVVFVGQEIDPNFLEQLFGVRTANEIPIDGQVTEEEILAPSGTALKDKFLNIIEAIRKEVDVPYMALSLTCQGRLDNAERRFWEMLIEDKGSGMTMSYSEFEARVKQGGLGGPGPGMIR